MRPFIFSLLCSSLSALSMGNPAEPQIMYRGLWISEEAALGLKIGYQGDAVFDRKFKTHEAKPHHEHFWMNQGVVTLNYIDRFELYGMAGGLSFAKKSRFTAGGGGRVLLAEWNNTGIGLDGKYQWSRPMREYQVGFGVYHTVKWFIPYVGVKYSNVHAHVDGKKLYSNVHWGCAIGFSLSSGKRYDLNFELDVIDELAISFGGNIKF